MHDIKIMDEYFYDFIKRNNVEEFKKFVLNFLNAEVCDDIEKLDKIDEIVKIRNKSESIQKEAEFYNLSDTGVISALVTNFCLVNIDRYSKIKEEIINLINKQNIEDIERILYFEIKFYQKIDQERLLDDLIDCYIESKLMNLKLEKNDDITNKLLEYFGDEYSRINEVLKYFEENKIFI